jgi:membrane protein DedA with SNARE-associated domain
MRKERVNFLLKNLGKGLAWFAVLVIAYILFKDRIIVDPDSLLGRVSDNPVLVFSIFLASEIIIGIIPPEIFMGWAANPKDPGLYIFYVTLLALISYGAGIIGFLFGRLMSNTILFRYTRRKFFTQVEMFFKSYGGFLIFVAAVTPIPFSAVCMLVGSVRYKFSRFLLISLTRFLRFGFYSYILWHAGSISI